MNRHEEWQCFTQQLQEKALKEYHASREYELSKLRQEDLYEMLFSELTEDQRTYVEEILYQILSFHGYEADLLYCRGLKDGIWLLKTLGVLS